MYPLATREEYILIPSLAIQCLIAIWPSFRTLPNHLPLSSGVTTQDFLCFFLFWL